MVSDCGVCRVFVRSTDNRPDQYVGDYEGGASYGGVERYMYIPREEGCHWNIMEEHQLQTINCL